jgi:hypothetical protein
MLGSIWGQGNKDGVHEGAGDASKWKVNAQPQVCGGKHMRGQQL